ncbi:2'-5' RNA ligase family protein [Aestuariicella hydrocarbonica]|uniref:2'-5' RNA ligase family protein n=1 Tax=Pseudomaricurvus hydrocarbonicus TaxID=1470433 RepID=A0A9E5MNN4_9GAMM|nr:2'-5' RNA ligase family protein [Aestuariicella hydrocarbonica]
MSFYYPQVYQEFLDARFTLPSLPGDHPDWHKGRRHYYCWAISVDSDDICRRWQQAQQHYAGYLRPDYHRQLHLTVAVCGFWQPQDLTSAHNDDFTPAMLQRQLERLQQAEIAPFHLDVGGVNSFASAPFLEIGDDHNLLGGLRELLLLNGDDFRSSIYCPHITLGLYRDRFESSVVGADFSVAIDTMPLKLAVSSLDLLSYEASAPAAPLKLEQRVWLS